MLGTQELRAYLEKYDLAIEPSFEPLLGEYVCNSTSMFVVCCLFPSCTRHPRKPWRKFILPENQHLACDEALDLIDRLLRYDHQERLTAREAMQHPYFSPVRKAEVDAKSKSASAVGLAASSSTGIGVGASASISRKGKFFASSLFPIYFYFVSFRVLVDCFEL